jgi:hypothetical protein
MPPGFTPKPPTLSSVDVERLIALIPALAREGSAMKPGTGSPLGGAAGTDGLPVEQLEKLEALLKKHGYTFPEFVMSLNALIATYIALVPEELDKQLPTENTPQIRKILDDPNVPAEQKEELRKQIAGVLANKGAIRQQIIAFATEENKRVVKPMLPKLKAAFASAESASRQAEADGAKGPRRSPATP